METQQNHFGASAHTKRQQRIINLILAALFVGAIYCTLFVGTS